MRLPLSRDGWLTFASCGSFAYGFLSIVLGLCRDSDAVEIAGYSQLDVPTRQSYAMPSFLTIAPLFTGPVLAVPSLGFPFLVAGGLKIIYGLWIFAVFRKVKPAEEEI